MTSKYDYQAYEYKTISSTVEIQCDKCGIEMKNVDSKQGEWYQFWCLECNHRVTISIKLEIE